MKNTITHILLISLILLTVLLGGIFSNRLDKEVLKSKKVMVFPIDKNFIEPEEIAKLIKLKDTLSGKINVESIEKQLSKNNFIANVEVYKDLNSNLYCYVEQYKPIARVIGSTSYYIDVDGKKRPLSNHYTENVILVYGDLNTKGQDDVYKLLKTINSDNILTDLVTEIHYKKSRNISLRLKEFKPVIKLGSIENLEEKIDKLKAIYSYLNKNKIDNKYKKIQLEYKNQVVCNK